MESLFPTEVLAKAKQLEANQLASCYLENKGDGSLEVKPLPEASQFAPIYSILTDDFNKDGHLDILLAGNLMETRVQFGRYDAGKGTLLYGNGAGEFRVSNNMDTGLLLKGSVRDLKQVLMKDGKKLILVAKNNEALQIMEVKEASVGM